MVRGQVRHPPLLPPPKGYCFEDAESISGLVLAQTQDFGLDLWFSEYNRDIPPLCLEEVIRQKLKRTFPNHFGGVDQVGVEWVGALPPRLPLPILFGGGGSTPPPPPQHPRKLIFVRGRQPQLWILAKNSFS